MSASDKTEQRFAIRFSIHGQFINGGQCGRKTKHP